MGRTRNRPAANADGEVEIRFDGEPRHKFEVDGIEIYGGKTGMVSAERANELLAAAWANVSLANESAAIWPQDDTEIEELAAKLGVELPTITAEGGSVPPTLADKIAALEAAGFTPESAAAQAADADTGTSNEPGKE